MTTGGRGGRVIPVTNANASGVGSLHQAMIVETGPRVAWVLIPNGSITTNAVWTITSGDLTVWCDTRFTLNGIVLHGYASNVILHGLEIIGTTQQPGYNPSPLFIGPTAAAGATVQQWALVDCALMNAYDDGCVVMDAKNVTLQNCIFQGRYDSSSNHAITIDGDEGADNITLVNCLMTGFARAPRTTGGQIEIVNCVSALTLQDFVQLRLHVPQYVNLLNNYRVAGADSEAFGALFEVNVDGSTTPESLTDSRFYFGGNVGLAYGDTAPGDEINEDTAVRWVGGDPEVNEVATPFNYPLVSPSRTAQEALTYVLASAGTPTRSAAQTAIIDAVQTAYDAVV